MSSLHVNIIESVLCPEWMDSLIEDYKKEVAAAPRLTFIPLSGRTAVWNICTYLDLNVHGINGQACHILESYLAKAVYNIDMNDESSERVICDLQSNILIIIGCCIQLATKMTSREGNIDAEILCHLIHELSGEMYSIQRIVEAEMEIFKTLDFYIPIRTTLDISELFAFEINLPPRIIQRLFDIINIAEFLKPSIVDKIRWVAKLNNNETVCRLHYAAGAVIAASYYIGGTIGDPAIRLSQLTGGTVLYLKCVAMAIFDELELYDFYALDNHINQ